MAAALLEAEEIGFSYRRGEPILSGWNAAFDTGECVAVTGPSGVGKSTVLYLLGLMLRPETGEVRFDGTAASSLPDSGRADLRARRFGFVFQDAALDPSRTVADNIVETALYRGDRRSEALARAQELMDRFDVGLRASHRPGQVSGGQAQRIALCRALLSSPDVVLADEPTGNLDPDTAKLVVTALREHAAQGSAVVVVTHDPAVAEACDRQVVMGR